MADLRRRARLAVTLSRTAARVSRYARRGDGSVIGGRVGLAVDPSLLGELSRGRRIALVSATNGKTTTTQLTAAALGALGEVATNAFGANMPTGHVAALGQALRAPYGVLECDEGYLPRVLAETGAEVVALLNLSRDQMDRAAEIGLIAQRWRQALDGADTRTVANCDDPLVAWAALTAKDVTWVSVGQRWKNDSWCCPDCGGLLEHEVGWRCGECALRRPEPDWTLTGETLTGPDGSTHRIALRLPGVANRANAAVAIAVAAAFGLPPERALPRLAQVDSVAGRYRTVDCHGRRVRLLLAKNPASWVEAFDIIEPAPAPVALLVNARGPDGRDTSWLWDVDFEQLRGRPICAAGERRLDLAARLEAAGVDFTVADGVVEAIDMLPAGRFDVIANYTAFQQLRTELGRVL